MNNNITKLSDYAALKKLASALWQQDSAYHGAAVMVGAGFSRSAASTGDATRKLPLWIDFSKKIAGELGSGSSDPLRLAEEYSAYFGRQALDDLIKKEINDPAWVPGSLHESLLKFPWSEILTTNWDTLLERASTDVHEHVYSVVYKQEDLSSARSPRIVKLHGTIDVTKDLIFTQEDYRKYPQYHSAFVNFSRQVFIENELCLLGFSGDDPNFIQWTGWVRDHLADHSRRIYLVGALGLSSAKRKYLESINIAPIDLNDAVAVDYDESDARHLEAIKIFFQALQDLKPKQAWRWSPTPGEIDFSVESLEEKLSFFESDRMSYPDWLICPYNQRFQLQSKVNSFWLNQKNLSAIPDKYKSKLLYEIAWHYRVTYDFIQPWLASELLKVCDPNEPCSLTKRQQLEIAVLLLKNTRWNNDQESEFVVKATISILENSEKYCVESSNELAYHQALMMRDNFDYSALEQYLEKISSINPVWKLRKASLFAEVGRFEKGRSLVAEAYRELIFQYRNDRGSIYIASRLAWADWLMRRIDYSSFRQESLDFSASYRDFKCDPWEHVEHIRDRVSDILGKQQKQKIEPSFEPGRYKDNSNTVNISNELHPLLLLEGISNAVGMPLRWDNFNYLSEQAADLTQLKDIDNFHCFSLAIRSANSDTSDVLGKVFSRIKIACLLESDVNFLLNQCIQAIKYWVAKWKEKSEDSGRYAIDRLRIFIEVLARVSVRAIPERAKQIFSLAVSLVKDDGVHHFWLFDPIKHLIEFSLKSIPSTQQYEILLEALIFPLQDEIAISDPKGWVNPIIEYPGERKKNTALDRRIDEIIDQIAPCSSKSAPALLRLLPLIEKNFLTNEELDKISVNIWGSDPKYDVVPDTGLLKHALLKLPSHNPDAVKNIVRSYLFEEKEINFSDQDLLMDMQNVARAKNIQEFPSEDQALAYFNQLVFWRPRKYNSDVLGFFKQEDRRTAKLVGSVLAKSVVPAMSSEALTKENFEKLHNFYAEVNASEALIAFSYFAAKDDVFVGRVEKIIKQSFYADDADKAAFASYAILKWRDLKQSPVVDKLILGLIFIIGYSRVVSLADLLWTTNQMYLKGYLSENNIDSLVEDIPVIFDGAAYNNISPSSRESISISFVRAACVKLARDLVKTCQHKNIELLRILEEAKHDALPEVRFAEILE